MSDENKETPKAPLSDAEREAKIKAAAEARAARAAAKQVEGSGNASGSGTAATGDTEVQVKEPSFNQPKLDRIVQRIAELVGVDAIVESYINERDHHLPYIIVSSEKWVDVANVLKTNEDMDFDYLRNLSGVDQETHIEVVYHLLSLTKRDEVCVKVKTDRDKASVPSVTLIWPTADWNEREVYDLLGVDFPGHPNLCRIMMPDDWVGHPLRKDYEPLDPEV
jgi:NADH-quinone oxidoreductase subunit C